MMTAFGFVRNQQKLKIDQVASSYVSQKYDIKCNDKGNMDNDKREEIILVIQFCKAHAKLTTTGLKERLIEKGRKACLVIKSPKGWDLDGKYFYWSQWKVNEDFWCIGYIASGCLK
eukprot:339417_1